MVTMIETSVPVRGEPLPVELMNTIWADRGEVHDTIADVDGLTAWLAAVANRADLADLTEQRPADQRPTDQGPAADQATLGEFRALRDALRSLAAAATGDERPVTAMTNVDVDTAVDVVNTASGRAPSWRVLDGTGEDGRRVRSRTGAPLTSAVLSRIADRAAVLFGSADQGELRACLAPGCVLYFVRDHPRREWCSAGCGNRARVARHYSRHHGRPGQS
jgi:predicted RNA-binding Zn ribbon-like protein